MLHRCTAFLMLVFIVFGTLSQGNKVNFKGLLTTVLMLFQGIDFNANVPNVLSFVL